MFITAVCLIFLHLLIFFSARERAEFNKSSNLIGSWSGRNFLIRIATAGGIRRVDLLSWTNWRKSSNFVSKFKTPTWKKCIVQPQGVLPRKVWFSHSTLELGMYLRRSYFFRSKLRWRKSQMLVMNRVRVLGSGLHSPKIVLAVLPHSPPLPSPLGTGTQGYHVWR